MSASDLDGYCGADEDCLTTDEMEDSQVCKKNGSNCVGETTEAAGYCEANTKEGCLAEPANYICKWGK